MSAGWSSQCSSSVWSSGTVGGTNLKEGTGTEIDLNRCPTRFLTAKNLRASACFSVSGFLHYMSLPQINVHARGGMRRWQPHLWKRPHSWRGACSQRWRTAAARFYLPPTRHRPLHASRTQCHLWCSHLQRREQHQQPVKADSKGNTTASQSEILVHGGYYSFWESLTLEQKCVMVLL